MSNEIVGYYAGEWLDIPSNDEKSWKAPEFAEQVEGSLRSVVFSSYKIVGDE